MGRRRQSQRVALHLRHVGAAHTRRGGAAGITHAGAGVAADTRPSSSPYIRGARAETTGAQVKCPNCGHLVLLREDVRTLAEVERERYRAALSRFGKDVTAAALSLGVSRSTMYRWMKRNGVSP